MSRLALPAARRGDYRLAAGQVGARSARPRQAARVRAASASMSALVALARDEGRELGPRSRSVLHSPSQAEPPVLPRSRHAHLNRVGRLPASAETAHLGDDRFRLSARQSRRYCFGDHGVARQAGELTIGFVAERLSADDEAGDPVVAEALAGCAPAEGRERSSAAGSPTHAYGRKRSRGIRRLIVCCTRQGGSSASTWPCLLDRRRAANC